MRRIVISVLAMVGMFGLVAAQPLAASANPAGANVVITEAITRHFDSSISNDIANAVEINNPTDSDINLIGWELEFYDSLGQLVASYTFNSADGTGSIPAGGFVLVKDPTFSLTGLVSGTPVGDYTLEPSAPDGLPDNGGVALFDASSAEVDGLAMSNITAVEGTPALPLNNDTDQAAQRFSPAGPSASIQRDILAGDGDNNRVDFSRHIANWGVMG